MKRFRSCRILAFLIAAIMLFTVTVPGTMAYVVTGTEPNINTFEPVKSEEGDFIIRKTVEHPFGASYKIPDGISFEFTVDLGKTYALNEIVTSAGNFKANDKGEITLRLKPGEAVTAEDIVDKTVITVTEKEIENDGFTVKDEAVKTLTVSGSEIPVADFVNVYAPEGVGLEMLTVKGTKTIAGRDWQKNDIFEFVIEQDNGDGSWVELGKETVSYSSDKDFNKFDLTQALEAVVFESAGTYSFRVSEIKGTVKDMVYDTTVNYITVTVGDADMDGRLEISDVTAEQNAVCTKDGESGEYTVEVFFSNTYKDSTGTSAPTTGDNSKIFIFVILALVSAAVLILLFVLIKKQQNAAKAAVGGADLGDGSVNNAEDSAE